MQIRHLEYFLAVVDTGTVTAAAKRCFVAQSALSTQVSQLERDLGGALFIRLPSGMALTSFGRALVPMAREVVEGIARTEQEMAALRGVLIGHLHIGVIQGLPTTVDLIGAVARFTRDHPGVAVTVSTGASEDHLDDVADGSIDIAVVATDDKAAPPGVSMRPMVADPLVVVSTQGRWEPDTAVTPAAVLECRPFIHYRARSGLRRAVAAVFERAGLEVDTRVQLDQIADMVQLAAGGVGATIVPAGAVDTGRFIPPTSVYPLAADQAHHRVAVAAPSEPSPAATAFSKLLDMSHAESKADRTSAFCQTER